MEPGFAENAMTVCVRCCQNLFRFIGSVIQKVNESSICFAGVSLVGLWVMYVCAGASDLYDRLRVPVTCYRKHVEMLCRLGAALACIKAVLSHFFQNEP